MLSSVGNSEKGGNVFGKEKFISNRNEIKQENNAIVSPGNYTEASLQRKDISAYFILRFERNHHNYFPPPTNSSIFLAHIETPSFIIVSKFSSFPYSSQSIYPFFIA
jgi:hypothetical protein